MRVYTFEDRRGARSIREIAYEVVQFRSGSSTKWCNLAAVQFRSGAITKWCISTQHGRYGPP